MKIQLPDGRQHILDENITLEEKLKIVEYLVKEFDSIIRINWHSYSVKFFLDSLASYIVWHKEPKEKGLEDKKVLSRKKIEKLTRYKKTSKQINFSDLPTEFKKILLGETRGAE